MKKLKRLYRGGGNPFAINNPLQVKTNIKFGNLADRMKTPTIPSSAEDEASMDSWMNGEEQGDSPTPSTGSKGLTALKDLIPYASNLANSFRKLPNPPTPVQESYINPNLVNYDATRGLINNKLAGYNRDTDYKVSNRTLAQGLKAKALGETTNSLSNLAQEEGNTNSIIKNQTAQFNQGTQARNLQRISDYNNENVARSIKQQELNTDNLADIGNKFQMQQRDKNLMGLEGRKLLINSLGLDKSYLGPESRSKLDDFQEEELKRLGYKEFGGYYDDPDPLKLLKERNSKRDSVRQLLLDKFPHNFSKVNDGMLDYFQKEPEKYKVHIKKPDGGPIPISRVSWKSMGLNSPDTVYRGSMYKMPYSVDHSIYNTPIPKGINPNENTYRTIPPNETNPVSLYEALQKRTKPVMFNTVSGDTTSHDRMGLKYGGIHINPANKGKFNALKHRTGKTTEELTHSSNPLTRKRAIFAQNAKKFHHKLGGEVVETSPEESALEAYQELKGGGDINFFQNGSIGGMYPVKFVAGGGLSRSSDYGSKAHPYPSVKSGDFAGGGRSYPIPTIHDAVDALRLAHLHGRSDVISKVYNKYPTLRKKLGGSLAY